MTETFDQAGLLANYQNVQLRLHKAEASSGRAASSVKLLAVSKTKPLSMILALSEAGQLAFGENYIQEALQKHQAWCNLAPHLPLEWHLIGPIQSNKTKHVVEIFDWVHSLDRSKIAQRLNEQRSAQLPPLKVLIQVNADNEDTKSGVAVDEVMNFAAEIMGYPRLELRGLMCIPAKADPLGAFVIMKQLFDDLQQQYPQVDTLSMGMSADLEAAVAAGSTLVRIGTDIFGAR